MVEVRSFHVLLVLAALHPVGLRIRIGERGCALHLVSCEGGAASWRQSSLLKRVGVTAKIQCELRYAFAFRVKIDCASEHM